jgi:Xaa-Pro aminopeptidase
MTAELGGADALLLIGDSERNSDLYYATRFRAPDPFVFLWTRQAKILLIGNLELDRARGQAAVDQVLPSAHYEKQLRDQGLENPGFRDVVLALLADLGLKSLKVPADFPLDPADFLRQAGIQLEVASVPLFPQRQIKTPDEVEALRRAMRATEQGMEVAVETIAAAQVRDQVLYWEGEVLTSERLRRMIHLTLLQQDCIAQHTIVACGTDGCDPHQEGSGPLRAGEAIIIDIFPREAASGYFGDITRTICKGAAPKALRALYDVVLRGQQLALEQICDGADGRQIHQTIQELFVQAGYKTGEKTGRMQGFFHSTGHGLGLDIHEAPRIGPKGDILKAGQVVTVEPGLYYPDLGGGVRIEDVVLVEKDGCDNLTTFPKFLEV